MTKFPKSTKNPPRGGLVHSTSLLNGWTDNLVFIVNQITLFVNRVWTRRELNPVSLGYQSNLANLPSPHRFNCTRQQKMLACSLSFSRTTLAGHEQTYNNKSMLKVKQARATASAISPSPIVQAITDRARRGCHPAGEGRRALAAVMPNGLILNPIKKAPVSQSFSDSGPTSGELDLSGLIILKQSNFVNPQWVWTGGELNPRSRNDKSSLLTRVRPTIPVYHWLFNQGAGVRFGPVTGSP